jgi:hypothetical protein
MESFLRHDADGGLVVLIIAPHARIGLLTALASIFEGQSL